MLKIIIKRDGSREPFQIKKAAKWNEWAANNQVNWTPLFEEVMEDFNSRESEEATSRELQMAYVNKLLAQKTWATNLMAGRLYVTVISKDFYPQGIPTLQQLHSRLHELGFMADLGYSTEEYAKMEEIIKHENDFNLAHYQIKQTTEKYCLQDRAKGERYETPQFVDMRLAMAMAANEVGDKKIEEAKEFYHHFSNNIVNNPTPNYLYVGTQRASSPSCCLYVMPDTVLGISAAHQIAELMAAGGAGLGVALKVRSAGDPIRGGELVHFGKQRYLGSHSKVATENVAAGRSGALAAYTMIYDPDFNYMVAMQNPRTPIAARNRDSHVAFMDNPEFARRVALNLDFKPWNTYTAPGLWELLTSGDDAAFTQAYKTWESANPDIKNVNARDTLLKFKVQTHHVGTVYGLDLCEVNRHTPHRDPINSSNLCTEIALPTKEYDTPEQLWKTEYFGEASIVVDDMGTIKTIPIEMGKTYEKIRHNLRRKVEGYCLLADDIVKIGDREMTVISTNIPQQPETALCNLSGTILSNMIDMSDEDMMRAMMVALKSVEHTINTTTYRIPHIGWTAKKRLNAGVGMMGLATVLARKGLRYDTRAGLSEIHRIMERHMYFLIKASIQLGRERGNAEWIDRTKWVDGWTPLETYNRNVDKYHDAELVYDWKALSEELIANGGMRFSTLFTIPPSESSSKKSGPPNAIYPIRGLNMKKSDSSNVLDWVAPFAEELRWDYQNAFDISRKDMILLYAMANKFTDHTVSCDRYDDCRGKEFISANEEIEEYLFMKEVGVPSHYYTNHKFNDDEEDAGSGAPVCSSEGCTL
jgi:ribonucleoside-diphosphate reductase alpha chain